MISIELDIFSGRPNPYWVLSDKEETELIDRITADKSAIMPDTLGEAKLGYRGFIVRVLNSDSPAHRKAINAGFTLPAVFRTGGDKQSAATGKWLLATSEKSTQKVDYCTLEVADAGITAAASKDFVQVDTSNQATTESFLPLPSGAGQSCVSNYLTGTDFSFWNGTWTYLHANNCYNFAANYRVGSLDAGFAVPGLQGGRPFTSLTTSALATALRYDGWSDSCVTSSISICFVIWPGTDFHFYRLVSMSSGRIWGHKPGCTNAKHTDDSGATISNPETCNRGPYTTFGEYFFAPGSRTVKGYGTPSRCR